MIFLKWKQMLRLKKRTLNKISDPIDLRIFEFICHHPKI